MNQQTLLKTKSFIIHIFIVITGTILLLLSCTPPNFSLQDNAPSTVQPTKSQNSITNNDTPATSGTNSDSPQHIATTVKTQTDTSINNNYSLIPTSTTATTFSLSAANLNELSDIKKEVIFFGGGGAGNCTGLEADGNKFIQYGYSSAKTISWPEPISIITCSWYANEKINLVVSLPDGTIQNHSLQASRDEGELNHIHYMDTDSVLGKYTFLFVGDQSGQLQYDVTVMSNDRPILFRLVASNSRTTSLILSNFQPQEQVRLFFYMAIKIGESYELQDWRQFQVDSDGSLEINVSNMDHYDEKELAIVAVGNIAGQVSTILVQQLPKHSSYQPFMQIFWPPANIRCDGAPPTRLDVGFRAEVTYTDGTGSSIRDLPASSNVLARIPEGTGMKIIGGPECHNNIVWWKVSTDGSHSGWISEGKENEYWLEPDN